MDARPFKLLNASECAWLADAVRLAAAGWLADWMPATTLRSVRAKDAQAAVSSNGLDDDAWTWSAPDAAGGAVSMSLASLRAGSLAARLLGPGHEGALAREVAQRAAGALAASLLGVAPGATPAGRQAGPAAEVWRRGSGAAHVALELGDLTIVFVADAAWVQARLAVRPRPVLPARPPLASRREAIGRARVRLQAWAGAVQLDIRTLQSLAPGDVLRLDRRLDQPLVLTVEGREADVRTYLGAQAGQRAVQLAAPR